uniref:Uncharacterized protein n=1 Tax=Lepeophtheirus salmonis TaxID=72036 RepID=A0A0K2V9M3_LEPSM
MIPIYILQIILRLFTRPNFDDFSNDEENIYQKVERGPILDRAAFREKLFSLCR